MRASVAACMLAGAIAAIVVAVMVAVPAGASAPDASTAGSCSGADTEPTAATINLARSAMRCLINRERTPRGLARLTKHAKLARAAEHHSRDMVRRNYFAHDSLTGATLLDRVRRAGYLRGAIGYALGENIAWGTGRLSTPAEIHKSLMASPGHRANILRARFRNVGIGIVPGVPEPGVRGLGSTWTVDFGVRKMRKGRRKGRRKVSRKGRRTAAASGPQRTNVADVPVATVS